MLNRRKVLFAAALMAAALPAMPVMASDSRLLADILAGVSDALTRDYIRRHYQEGRWDGRYWWYRGNRYTPATYRRFWIDDYYRHYPSPPPAHRPPPLFLQAVPRSRYFHLHLSCSASVPPQLSPFAFFFLLPVILFFLCASALFLPAQTLFWVSETQLYPHDSRFQFQIFKNFPDIEISFSHFRYSDVIQACDSLLFPSGICCVMQWMFPPPSRISRAGTG